MKKMFQTVVDFFKDRHAAMQLDDQFASRTGHPIYQATLAEGHQFRLSGMTAHEWLMSGPRGPNK